MSDIGDPEGLSPVQNIRPLQEKDLAAVKSILGKWIRYPAETGPILTKEVDETWTSMRESIGGQTGKLYLVEF